MHPTDRAGLCFNAGHGAVFDDINAQGTGSARIAPGHRIVARHARTALPDPAHQGKARIAGLIEQGNAGLGLGCGHEMAIHAIELHGIGDAGADLHLGGGMGGDQHAALGQHDVIVQLF